MVDPMTSKEPNQPVSISVAETADYIAALSKELAAMAHTHRLDILSYLLEMAAKEALLYCQNAPSGNRIKNQKRQ
jgi:hypothetical protein